jgi:hypothetical protein
MTSALLGSPIVRSVDNPGFVQLTYPMSAIGD